MEPKVSIIMPVYNSEKYVSDAIESVLAQDYNNFELICVNDGSTDNSLNILRKFEAKDPRIKVYTKDNGGISSTRNYGIKKATGEYISFIDNDDQYKRNLLSDNIKIMEENKSEIIKFNKAKRYIGIENKEEINKVNFDIMKLEDEEIWKNFDKIFKFGGTIWNAIYRRDFLIKYNILFDESKRNVIEDHQFNLECYKHITKISLNPKTYYIWKMRVQHSTTGKFIKERFEDIKLQANNLYMLLIQKQINVFKPHFWAKLKLSYLINIILVMNYEGSDFNIKQAKKYFKNLTQYELFKRKCDIGDYKYLRKIESTFRIISIILFDLKLYSILFFLSNIKMKKEIESSNRRF